MADCSACAGSISPNHTTSGRSGEPQVAHGGGPGTASETINIYLYNSAFAYYDIGYSSAMVIVFFVLIVTLSFVLLMLRQRMQWSETEGR